MFTLKPYPQWRKYKIELMNGKFIDCKKQIRSGYDLEKATYGLDIKNIYESVSTFLDAKNVRGTMTQSRGGYKPILLNSLVFLDFDKSNLDMVKKAIDWFKNKREYKLWKIVQTSQNSYHVYYFDLNKDYLRGHPHQRVMVIMKRRKELETQLLEAGIDIDKLTSDVWRVSRVIGSVNNNHEIPFTCKEITKEVLNSPQSLSNEAMTKQGTPSPSIYQRNARRGVMASPTFMRYKFITNRIHGVKDCFVSYVEIDKERRYQKLAEQLQKNYNLGTLYVFDTGNRIALLSLKALDKRRVTKVLKFAKSYNVNTFIKYGHVWVKTSNIIKKEAIDKLMLIDIIPSKMKGQVSRPHADFVKEIAGEFAVNEMENEMIGDKNDIQIAMVKETHS